MASTVGSIYATGAVAATGANIDIRVAGFKPRKVVVQNLTNQCALEWCDAQAAGSGTKTVAAGTRTNPASAGISPLDADSAGNPGFQIGTLADINDTAGESLIWEAQS